MVFDANRPPRLRCEKTGLAGRELAGMHSGPGGITRHLEVGTLDRFAQTARASRPYSLRCKVLGAEL